MHSVLLHRLDMRDNKLIYAINQERENQRAEVSNRVTRRMVTSFTQFLRLELIQLFFCRRLKPEPQATKFPSRSMQNVLIEFLSAARLVSFDFRNKICVFTTFEALSQSPCDLGRKFFDWKGAQKEKKVFVDVNFIIWQAGGMLRKWRKSGKNFSQLFVRVSGIRYAFVVTQRRSIWIIRSPLG